MFSRSIRISLILVSLLCLLNFSAYAEDFSNTVKNVKVTSAGEGGVVVDVYINSTDPNVKPQLSTRKYKDDQYVIDLMQVTQAGNVSKDTTAAGNSVKSSGIKVGKLPGGTARILLDLDNPDVKVKDVRYHVIQDNKTPEVAKEQPKTNTNVLPDPKAQAKPVSKDVKTNTNVLQNQKDNKVAAKPQDKPKVLNKELEKTVNKEKVNQPKVEAKQVVQQGPQIVHKTEKPVEIKVEKKPEVTQVQQKDLKPITVKPVNDEPKIKQNSKPEVPVIPEKKPVINVEHKVEPAVSEEHILDDVPEVILVQTQAEEHKEPVATEQTPLNLDDTTDEENLKIVDVKKAEEFDLTGMLLTIIGAMVVILPLIFLAVWLINLFYKGGDSMGLKTISNMGGGNKFKILSSTSLGQGKSIHLVEIRGRQLVIGCTNNSINILTEFGDFDEFVDEQNPSVDVQESSVNRPSPTSPKRFKKGRAPLGSFADLYKDYTSKIDEQDLEDEY
ncbi:MAG: flagellar biosynthetic protein FliO [Vampirovibrionia bacterium]